jgi:V-type H+-transporting ATPase subunit a
MIILMGLFSMFTGLVYNDMFSQMMSLMTSEWNYKYENGTDRFFGEKTPFVYGFGVDPAWRGAENALLFSNSYKMKMSVIMGVVHVILYIM